MEEDQRSVKTHDHPPEQFGIVLKKLWKKFHAGKLPKLDIKVIAKFRDGRELEVTKTFEHPSDSSRSPSPRFDKPVKPRPETMPVYDELRARFETLKPKPSTYSDFLFDVLQRLQEAKTAEALFDSLYVRLLALNGEERSFHGLVIAAGFLIEADHRPHSDDLSHSLRMAQLALELNDEAIARIAWNKEANKQHRIAGGKAAHANDVHVHNFAAQCLVTYCPNGGWPTKAAAIKAIAEDVFRFVSEHRIPLKASNLDANLRLWMSRKGNPVCIAFNQTKAP